MHPVSYLVTLQAAAVAVALPLTTTAPDVDYGHWDMNVTTAYDAAGYRWGNVYAEYSEAPGHISHSGWMWSPKDLVNSITADTAGFKSSMVYGVGDQRTSMCELLGRRWLTC